MNNYGLDIIEVAVDFTPIGGEVLTETYRYKSIIICGECGAGKQYHTNKYRDNFSYICDRTIEEWEDSDYSPSGDDYYRHAFANGTETSSLIPDLMGNEANVVALLERDITSTDVDYVEWDRQDSQLVDNWTDRNPDEHTSAIDAWYVTPTVIRSITYPTGDARTLNSLDFSNDKRSVFIEGFNGFISEIMLDLDKTRKYQARLLNVFKDKVTGELRCGSVRFKHLTTSGPIVTNYIEAYCVNNRCPSSVTPMYLNLDTAERTAQELFVMAAIRHGNNHAAAFIRNRPDWYKIHSPECDLSCDVNEAFCNWNKPAPDTTDVELSDIEFIMEHQRYCNDNKCKCAEWLANELASLNDFPTHIKDVA